LKQLSLKNLFIKHWQHIKGKMQNCKSAYLMTNKVQNKMWKYFASDTESTLVTDWFDL